MLRFSSIQNVLISSIFAVLFSACQSTVVNVAPTDNLLHDQGYLGFSTVNIESEHQVFFLDETAKAFVGSTIEPYKNKLDQMEALVKAIFDRSELNLLYQGDANTIANDTFKARAANCLSMSIMTYALATEAGFEVNFQEIMIPEYWTRRAGFSLLNGHINLKMLTPKDPNVYLFNTRSYQVDFDPQSSRRGLPKKIVSKKAILSMFYNNKGADAVLRKDYLSAYAYFREALRIQPNFHSAWINLGIVYRLSGYFPQAESAYHHALTINTDSLTAMENLAYLYKLTNRMVEAEEILSKVADRRNNNPYYHVDLGEQQMEQQHWDQALEHFRKALALDRNKHEVYFGLARAYFEIGELQQSERYLKQAKNKARNKQDEQMYQSKLEFLSRL
ncbi:tetratricopeptide repeat protein [Paraglaciecola arctica]|uniref:tetratricopeptide repeat protein n=1 Tax=Paraglaciecola arctica TaxID=1128911 RepID=UPI001C07A675|nr:tetratricopeptide repeat protein [Paraglaciecola arctica]MBU3002221.1 tetratricopeptide repeat protein [Paraglaciecola arctica]